MLNSSDAGNSDMPRRSQPVVLSCENVEVLHLIKEEKIIGEVAKIYGKTESFIYEIVRKEKEVCAPFAIIPQTANVDGHKWHFVMLRHHKREASTVRYLRERASPSFTKLFLQYTIIIVLCPYYFCLIYKLNFMVGRCEYEKKRNTTDPRKMSFHSASFLLYH